MIEIWKTHPEISDSYEFSNLGRFKNVKTNQILKPTIDIGSTGVATFLMTKVGKRKKFRIARVIAEIFIPNSNPKLKVVIHKDDNCLNNEVNNLKWGTTKETVDIAFDKNKRTSNWEVLSNEDVTSIRTEFNETEITAFELAEKFKTTVLNINSILYYKTRFRVNPERPYKLNQLKGIELEFFLSIKKNRSQKLSRDRKKIKTLQALIIADDILNEIGYDFVNSTASLKELSIKYKVSYKALRYQFKTLILPKVTILDGELFKEINDTTQLSNFGRVIIDNKISNSRRFTVNGKIIGIRILISELFLPNPDPSRNTFLNSIDGNLWNVSLDNLEWIAPYKAQHITNNKSSEVMVMVDNIVRPLSEVKDIIINDYLTTTEYVDFRAKYLIGYTPLYQLLRPYMKEKRDGKPYCELCGDTNPRHFYKSRRTACKLCICDGKAEQNKLVPKKNVIGLVKYPHRPNKQLKYKLSGSKSRAKAKNWEFDLTEDFIKELYNKQNGKCAYSGEPLSLEEKSDDKEPFSIDRVDSLKGYTKDNVKLVTGYINRMKLNWEYDDFLSVIKNIYEHNSLQNFSQKKFFKKGVPTRKSEKISPGFW